MTLAFRALKLIVCATAVSSAIFADGAFCREVTSISTEILTYPVRNFKIGSRETQFGPFQFVGGMEMRSTLDHFGAISGFRFLSPGEEFLGVTDTGFWLHGTIDRDANGLPVGVTDFSMQPMVGKDGVASDEKWHTDVEALVVRSDEATVAFEYKHRIATFRIRPERIGPRSGQIDFLVPVHELRRNKGFEVAAYSRRMRRLRVRG